jgi:hypothetical protein
MRYRVKGAFALPNYHLGGALLVIGTGFDEG